MISLSSSNIRHPVTESFITFHYTHTHTHTRNYTQLHFYMIYLLNCNWVATRWQQYSTHLHTDNMQNDTKQTIHKTTQKFWKSAGCAPSLGVLLWDLAYN